MKTALIQQAYHASKEKTLQVTIRKYRKLHRMVHNLLYYRSYIKPNTFVKVRIQNFLIMQLTLNPT